MGLVLAYRKSTAQPQFSGTPAISGTLAVGETLTASLGGLAGHRDYSVVWYSYNSDGGQELQIGTGLTYLLSGNEFQRRIGIKVNASNNAGTVSALSELTTLVADSTPTVPIFNGPVTISGQAEIGETLTVVYDVSGESSLEIEWNSYTNEAKANQQLIGTAETLAVTFAEDAKYIDATVIAYDSLGNAVRSSSAFVGPVQPDAALAPEILSGAIVGLDELAVSCAEGEYLICDFAFSGHTSDPTVAWYKCDDAAGANPELLAGAGVAPINPLPVTQPNQYRAALLLDQSLGLASGSKYVYAIASAANGVDTTNSTSNIVGPVAAIVGTAISQSTVGDGTTPYKIDTPGTYYLSEDITTDGTAIAITTNSVTLNLNGKTITFSDADAIDIEGDFATHATWDFTNTGNTDAGVGDPGGNEYAAIQTGATEQDAYNSGVAHAGLASLRFGVAAVSDAGVEHFVKSAEFSCDADKWYFVNWMATANNKTRPDIFVRLRDSNDNLIHTWEVVGSRTEAEIKMFQKSWRYCEFAFKAVASPATYYLEVGVRGRSGVTSAVSFDDFNVARGRVAGVAIGVDKNLSSTVNWDEFYGASNQFTTCENATGAFTAPPVPDAAWNGFAENCIVKNGAIVQGASKGGFAAGVMLRSGGAKLGRVSATTTGPTTSAVRSQHWGVWFTAYDCEFVPAHKTCGQREYYYGGAVWLLGGAMHRCTVRENCAVGIFTTSGGITLTGCTFKSKERYTNQFAVELYNGGPVNISDNIIDNLGEYYGRGIHTGSNNTGVIRNNRIAIQSSAWNSEYNGYLDYRGGYALQVEGTPGVGGLDVYGNTLYAYAGGAYLPTSPTERDRAQACRPNQVYGLGLTRIYSNVMIAEAANGTAQAWCYCPEKCQSGAIVVEDNVMQTNSGLVFAAECQGAVLTRTNIVYETMEPASWPIVAGYTSGYSLENPSFTIELRDSTFNALADTTLYAEKPRNYTNGSTAPNPSDPDLWYAVGWITISWTITVDAGEAGASVSVTNSADEVVATGVTDEFGLFATTITQQRSDVTSGIVDYNDHTASVVSGDLARSGSVVFTADSTKTVTVALV